MTEKKYKVLIKDRVVADNMNLKEATILVRALFEEYYKDSFLVISIREMDRIEEWGEKGNG